MEEHLVRRTIFVAQCGCGERDERVDNPPREKKCPKCGKWVKFIVESWTGPNKF